MTSLAEYASANPSRHGVSCMVSKLPTDVRAQVDGATELIPSTTITRWLDSVGHKVSAGSVQRHRRRECNCGRG